MPSAGLSRGPVLVFLLISSARLHLFLATEEVGGVAILVIRVRVTGSWSLVPGKVLEMVIRSER